MSQPEAPSGVAVMFPGQGSQFPGMGADLFRESAGAREIFQRADDALGYSLTRIMIDDDGNLLNRTIHTQPAVFVHSMALWRLWREREPRPPFVAAGHSLGEYSALCAAGVLEFEDALDIIRVRAEGMDLAQPVGTCGMAALVGVNRERALEIVEESRGDDVLEAANFNAPDQLVVSGRLSAVRRTIEAAKSEKRGRAVLLPVSSAFHTELMTPAREKLAERLTDVRLRSPAFPVLSNVDGRPYRLPECGPQPMLDQVVSPVRWEDCVRTMVETGARDFVEIGPGKVLTGLMRRIDRSLAGRAITDIESIRLFAEAEAS